MEVKSNFPISDAKEFINLQYKFHEIQFRLWDLGRELFYKYQKNGFVFSDQDPRNSESTILNDLKPEELSESDKGTYNDISKLVEERKILIGQIEDHEYSRWFSESVSLKRSLDKYLKKGPIAKYGSYRNGNIFIFVRVVTDELIKFYERSNDDNALSGYVLTKERRNRLIDLSQRLQNEMHGLTGIVAGHSQAYISDFLGEFIDELRSDQDSSGLAAKKNHSKLNREILIKSLSSYFYEFDKAIPVDMIVDVVSVVDPEITERKVYEIVSKIRSYLQAQQHRRFDY